MSLKTAHDLSISELLNELNQKLGLEFARLRETYLPPGVSVVSLKAEVSTGPIEPSRRINCEPFRSKISKPEHAKF